MSDNLQATYFRQLLAGDGGMLQHPVKTEKDGVKTEKDGKPEITPIPSRCSKNNCFNNKGDLQTIFRFIDS